MPSDGILYLKVIFKKSYVTFSFVYLWTITVLHHENLQDRWKTMLCRSSYDIFALPEFKPFNKCSIVCVHDCLCKQFFAANSQQAHSNLICLTILAFNKLSPKIRGTNLQKLLRFVLLNNYICDFFNKVQTW